jgi:hypothetical protein
VRDAARGRYALELRGDVKSGAMGARRLPVLRPGTYRLTLSVKGRLGLAVGSDAAHRGVGITSGRRWRRTSVMVRVPSRTRRSVLSLWTARGRSAKVDDVALTRVR